MAAALRKVLVVVGSTGAGKTKLSIDLAKAVGGEIINSDAMQMYKGLDIATAKITEPEKDGVTHHLLDVVDPSGRCDVLDFKQRALRAIDDVLARGKVPIIVGGTMYYTQSILWNAQLLDDVPTRENAPTIPETATPEEIYAMLKDVDPVMASRWHVNQTRRVRRSLEVFYQTGVQHSELIARQASAQQHTEKLFDACAFWIHCQNKKVLTERLAKRVDTMMETGLVDEIQKLRAQVLLNPPRYATPTASRDSGVDTGETEEEEEENGLDYSVGILQAIGYKEFAPYLEALDARQQQREEGESDDLSKQRDAALETLLQSCIEQLNIATRQYARRQLSWIRNRFVPRNIPVYQVDSSDITRWTTDVATPAIEIATAFLQGEEIKAMTLQQTEPGKYTPLSDVEKYKEQVCVICGDRKFVGTSQWELHLKSKGHKFHVRRIEMEKERPRWEQFREAKKASRQEKDKAGNDEEPTTKESE